MIVAGSGFLGERERLVGRGRQQQHLGITVVEELLRQLGAFAPLLDRQQVPEALELVEDDQVGLKRLDSGPRQRRPQSPGQLPAAAAKIVGELLASTDVAEKQLEVAPLAGGPDRSPELAPQ